MSIPRALRSIWLVRALILIVSHALAVQFSQTAVTDATPPADVILAAPSGEGNFPADFKGENNGVAMGAVITWSAPQNIAGDSDVITGGSLVGAFNVGDTGVSAATVNGVTFNPFALGGASSGTIGNFTLATTDIFLSDNVFHDSTAAPFTNLSAGYKTLLASATLTATPANFTLTMSGLTLGHQYKFQWFVNTSGPGAQLHLASAGNTVALSDNVSNLDGGLGQFVVGTFVADALSEVITFSPNSGSGQAAQLNGFQLRDLGAVPEPTGTVLTFSGLCVLMTRRKRAARA